jgi:hypothetical protein
LQGNSFPIALFFIRQKFSRSFHLLQGNSFPGRFTFRKAVVSQDVSSLAKTAISNVIKNILQPYKINVHNIMDTPEGDERAASLQDQ